MQAKDFKILNDHQILIYFSDGRKRLFDISYIMNDLEMSEAMKFRWRKMVENGNFANVELLYGDLVWPGWVEILSGEILKFTVPFESEVNGDAAHTQ